MVIEMVAGEISEDRDLKSQPIAAVQMDRLRRSFHYANLAAVIDGLAEKAVRVRCLWRGSHGRFAFFADSVFDCGQHRGFLSGGLGQGKAEIGSCRFAVGTGDADEVEVVRWVAVNDCGSFRKCFAGVCDLEPGTRKISGPVGFGDDPDRAAPHYVFDKTMTVHRRACDGHKKRAFVSLA